MENSMPMLLKWAKQLLLNSIFTTATVQKAARVLLWWLKGVCWRWQQPKMWKQFNIYTLVGVNKQQTSVLPINATFILGWAHLPVRTRELRDCSDGFGAKWRNLKCKTLWVKLFIRIMTAAGPCQPGRGFVIPDVTQALMEKHVATIKKETAKNNNVKLEILKVYETCQIFTY